MLIDACAGIVTDREKIAALRLVRSENIGIKTFFSLLKLFGSAVKALERVPNLSLRGGRSKPINLYSEEQTNKELEALASYGAELVYFQDETYPILLKEIVDFPPIITIFGQRRDLLSKTKVAIVGSRNGSINGTRFAYKIAREAGERGLITVSGLARGIDSYVHKASLESGTIAIIAGGVDNIYPPENHMLYKAIAENGLIITENAFGSSPKAQSFPQRNRIISGLSVAVIVVEAGIKSGSLITANFALEHNRELFAVPGFPLDARYSGTNALIKQGAYLLENIEDLTNVMDSKKSNSIRRDTLLFDYREEFLEEIFDYDNSDCEKDLEKIRTLLLSKLSNAPISIDYLIRELKVPVNILMMIIVELELAGKLQRVSGNSVVLIMS